MVRETRPQYRLTVTLAVLLAMAAAVAKDYHGIGTLARNIALRVVELAGEERAARATLRVSRAFRRVLARAPSGEEAQFLAGRAELIREQQAALEQELDAPVQIPSLETGRSRLIRLLQSRAMASVISPGPLRWSRMLVLDVGTANRVEAGDAVISGPDLVGVVIRAGRSTCSVRRADDIRSRIETRCARTEEYIGTVQGTPEGGLQIPEVPLSADVREGDIVLSSGLGDQLPDGLIVGTVTAYHRRSDPRMPGAVRASATLAPLVDLGSVADVSVLRTSAERRPADGS